jgi:hypothetical protein
MNAQDHNKTLHALGSFKCVCYCRHSSTGSTCPKNTHKHHMSSAIVTTHMDRSAQTIQILQGKTIKIFNSGKKRTLLSKNSLEILRKSLDRLEVHGGTLLRPHMIWYTYQRPLCQCSVLVQHSVQACHITHINSTDVHI